MKKILALCKRDFVNYFTTPIAYILLAIFLFLVGNIFWLTYASYAEAYRAYSSYPWAKEELTLGQMVLRPYFMIMSNILMFFIPMITMRLLSEEKKLGTIEFLLTSPVTIPQIIIGKYLAAVALVLTMFAGSAIYPLLLQIYGHPDLGLLASGYLGLLLMAMAFIALGLFASSLTENQIVAAIIGFSMLMLFWIINWGAKNVGNSTINKLLNYLSLSDHFADFAKGIIDTQHVIYFASIALLGLFLTGIIVQSHRWR